MEFQIKLAEDNDAENITTLLNNVTLKLHEKGINQWDYPWNPEEIQADIRNKNTFVVAAGEELIGVFSLKAINVKQWFNDQKESLYLYRIAVAPEYQSKNIGKRIVEFAIKLAQEKNQSMCLDCWAGNKKLRSFYTDSGLRYVGDFAEEDYMISVFRTMV